MLLYATRGFRGIDDDRSICFQLRSGGFDGPVLKDGFLAQSIDDWDPRGEGKRYFKQHGHPVAFGVPKSAVIAGKTPRHANVFVAKWRTRAIAIDSGGKIAGESSRVGQGVEWVQFRLSPDENDLEIIQPAAELRQRGFETGPAICSAPKYGWMNQTYVNAVSLNTNCDEWIDANHFAGDRVAALRYVFNVERGIYEWTEAGDYLIDPLGGVSEASVVPWNGQWIVGARLAGVPIDKPNRPKRGAHGVGWLRTSDPFRAEGEIAFPTIPSCQGGRTAYHCADGVLRLFSGDATVAPNNGKPRNKRNPIYSWDIDPDANWTASPPSMIFDAWRSSAVMRPNSVPMCDMIKVMPAASRSQLLLHRLTFATADSAPDEQEIDACGIYYARMDFEQDVPPTWQFVGDAT